MECMRCRPVERELACPGSSRGSSQECQVRIVRIYSRSSAPLLALCLHNVASSYAWRLRRAFHPQPAAGPAGVDCYQSRSDDGLPWNDRRKGRLPAAIPSARLRGVAAGQRGTPASRPPVAALPVGAAILHLGRPRFQLPMIKRLCTSRSARLASFATHSMRPLSGFASIFAGVVKVPS
jgi:hypothetical protein